MKRMNRKGLKPNLSTKQGVTPARAVFLLFILTIATTLSLPLYGQYNIKENSVWAFGYQTGLDFSSGVPVPTAPLALPGNSGSASVCDSSGALLFYTNGYNVWDKNNQVMPNGYAIFSLGGRTSPYSATQGALIVPVLSNHNQYYVFSEEGSTYSPYGFGPSLGTIDSAVCRLYYSVVDMSLNNGSGDIVAGEKSILIDSMLNGSMIAIRGDSCNIWVLTHVVDQDIFKAYNITTTGIDPNPVISTTGTLPSFSKAYINSRMRVSPDRSKIGLISTGDGGGVTDAGVELYDFDPATGKVSNAQYIDHIGGSGIAFSPDNSKLYITGIDATTFERNLFQYDITQPTAIAITNSRKIIASNAQWIDLRLAPNGKIYHISSTGNERLAVINNPNLSGTACNYEDSVLVSPGPPWSYMFGSYFSAEYVKAASSDTLIAKTDTLVCPNLDNLNLHAISGASSYLWDNGSTDSIRPITKAGTYYVRSRIDFCTTRIDTFTVDFYNFPHAVINVTGFILGTVDTYATYQWMLDGALIPGATDSTYTVTQNGDYQVIVTNNAGCMDTSDIYTVNNAGIDNASALAQTIKVYPNPATERITIQSPVKVNITLTDVSGRTIKQVTQTRHINISSLAPGLYLLKISSRDGTLIKVAKVIKQEE